MAHGRCDQGCAESVVNNAGKLATARAVAAETAPYFRAELLRIVTREAEWLAMPTMAMSDRQVLYWHPDFVVKESIPVLAGAFMHEFMHHLLHDCDPARQGDRWNAAFDLRINPMVRDMRLPLPDGVYFPQRFNLPEGETAAWYYAHLPTDPNGKPKPSSGSKPGDGEKTGQGKCGKCAGNPAQGEPDGDPDERAQVEVDASRQRAAEAVRKWAQQKGRGSLPAGLERWAEEFLKPHKIRWQDELARRARSFVAHRIGMRDYSFSRPSRRSLAGGNNDPIRPGMIAPEPRACLLMDTSGSMSGDQLGIIVRESRGILKSIGTDMDCIAIDSQIHGMKRVRDWREVAKLLKGGGGSDFRPAFEELAKRRERPDVIIAATDGMIGVPENAPRWANVIWLLTGKGAQPPCKWGHAIMVPE